MKLDKELIKNKLKTKTLGRNLCFFESTTSTFDEAGKLAPLHGTLICARHQTNGVGRLAREWISPDGGIYFTLVLKADIDKAWLYTIICALSVQRAIEKHIPCAIKWPNDIVSRQGKKLCGILTKSAFSPSKEQFINVGVGINANSDPDCAILPFATSVKCTKGVEIDENELLCDVLFEIESCLEMPESELLSQYRQNCITVGKDVSIDRFDGKKTRAKCIGIAPDGSAIMQREDKSVFEVNSGEVSVRGIYGENYV